MTTTRSCVLLAAALTTGCALKSALPEIGEIPRFSLTAQDGGVFGSESLEGKVWVANFIFTTCHGPCPRMSSQMRRLQDDLTAQHNVHFVSFTVDPENDTPAALAAYGRQFGADAGRWHLLTGPKEELNKLSYDAFHLSSIGGAVPDHSTRFALVDKKRRLRGYYDSSDPDALQELRKDIGSLLREVL